MNDIAEPDEVEKFIVDEIKIDKIKNCIFEGLHKQDFDTQIFVMAQIEPIYKIAQKTNIARSSLLKAYGRVQIKLKKII